MKKLWLLFVLFSFSLLVVGCTEKPTDDDDDEYKAKKTVGITSFCSSSLYGLNQFLEGALAEHPGLVMPDHFQRELCQTGFLPILKAHFCVQQGYCITAIRRYTARCNLVGKQNREGLIITGQAK